MLGAVINPTGLDGSPRTSLNVIPGRAVLALRLPDPARPGARSRSRRPWPRRSPVSSTSSTWLENMGGTASPADSPLFDLIAGFMPQLEEGAKLVPTISAGFTDSHYFREAFGNVAYGFMPKRTDPSETWPLIHSADERVLKDDLELGAEFFVYAARTVGAIS